MPLTLQSLSEFINQSLDSKDADALRRATHRAQSLRSRLSDPVDSAYLDWFEANAWSGIADIIRADGRDRWGWEQPEYEKVILLLRRAAGISTATDAMPIEGMCRILTNLGNALDFVGRFVEAIPCWEKALSLQSTFSMARGNLGLGLANYGDALWAIHDKTVAYERAYAQLSNLGPDIEPHAGHPFSITRKRMRSILARRAEPGEVAEEKRPGETPEELRYRAWCRSKRLILNPLNDLVSSDSAASDNLTLHGIRVPITHGPYYHGLFNQMKQEYVSARWFLYDGTENRATHFADRAVTLCNTLDYPVYGISVEKVRVAFRMAYSLFDKMAYFLNHYFDLGIKERLVDFRTIWYQERNRTLGLSTSFRSAQNLPLRGLFWVSKDLSGDAGGAYQGMDPDAAKLKDLRNHLEHKYLKVHEFGTPSSEDPFLDKLAYSIDRHDLETTTLTLFRLVRASLIYLSLAVANEEHRRCREHGKSGFAPSMYLDRFEDDWKT